MDTYSFENIDVYEGLRSPTGTVENDMTTRYFERCLYQRLLSVLNFRLPDGWNEEYFKYTLFGYGFIGIIKTSTYGIIPQQCALSGYGLYRQPTDMTVAQPLVSFTGKIGKDCSLIKLTQDYRGVWDIVEHHAIQLSTIYTSIKMSLKNSRLSFLLGAKNKAAARTLEVIAEKISAGEPVIIFDKKMMDDIHGNSPIWSETFDVEKSYITDKLLSDMRTIVENFDHEIGIPTVNAKKERMITNEVELMTADSCARINAWKQCLDKSIAATNKLFDLDISYTALGGAE